MTSTNRLQAYSLSIAASFCTDGKDEALSESVVSALSAVPRHRFVERFYLASREDVRGVRFLEYQVDPAAPDPSVLDLVYSDQALVTRLDRENRPSSSTSQPSLVAVMLELLELSPGMRVMEIGAGTGYNAALIAELVGDPALVTTIDIQPDVAGDAQRFLSANGYGDIRVLCRDGAEGAEEHAPFDRIVATVGCPDISWQWVNQLIDGGVMLVPLQHGGPNADPLVRLSRTRATRVEGAVAAWSGFMPLQGNKNVELWPEDVAEDSSEPDARYDLFHALSEAPRTMDSYRAGKTAWWDFSYFLALEDKRTHVGRVLALADPSGDLIVVSDDGIRLWGNDGLFRDLVSCYQRWEILGRPALADWAVEFVPRTAPRPHDDRPGTWVLPRPNSWQTVHLIANDMTHRHHWVWSP